MIPRRTDSNFSGVTLERHQTGTPQRAAFRDAGAQHSQHPRVARQAREASFTWSLNPNREKIETRLHLQSLAPALAAEQQQS